MRKYLYVMISLSCLIAMVSSCSTQDGENTYNPWEDGTLTVKQRLESLPDVASVTVDSSKENYPQGVYKVMFKLPIDHNDASKGTFLNKVYVGVQNVDSLNTVWFSGYNIDSLSGKKAVATMLNSNMINIEHRDFGESSTNTAFAYLTTAQAAADQNQILNNLELLFKRRYAITGASKGGMTVTMLAGYYPDRDAVYFPMSAPFARSVNDVAGHDFILNTVGTPEQRKNILETQRRFLQLVKDTSIMNDFKQCLVANNALPEDLETSVEDIYYYDIQEYGTMIWQYFHYNDSFIPDESLEGQELWTWLKGTRLFSLFLGNTNASLRTYWVQTVRELGAYGYRNNMSDIYSPQQPVFCMACLPPQFHNETYTGETFSKYVDKAVATTTLPMMFIYGAEDPWAAWAINDSYVNGSNVKKYVVPNENHRVDYQSSALSSEQSEEIKSWILHYMYR